MSACLSQVTLRGGGGGLCLFLVTSGVLVLLSPSGDSGFVFSCSLSSVFGNFAYGGDIGGLNCEFCLSQRGWYAIIKAHLNNLSGRKRLNQAREILNQARVSKKNFERTAKRLEKLPLRLVKGKKLAADDNDRQLLEKVENQLKSLQEANGNIARNLNEVELSLLQLRHSKRLKKQARRDMTLAEQAAEKAAAKQARKDKRVAEKARKAEEKAARRQARDAKKAAKKAEKAKKEAAEKAAKQARKDAKRRAKQQKKGGAAAPAAPAAAAAPTTGGPGSGLLASQSSN